MCACVQAELPVPILVGGRLIFEETCAGTQKSVDSTKRAKGNGGVLGKYTDHLDCMYIAFIMKYEVGLPPKYTKTRLE